MTVYNRLHTMHPTNRTSTISQRPLSDKRLFCLIERKGEKGSILISHATAWYSAGPINLIIPANSIETIFNVFS